MNPKAQVQTRRLIEDWLPIAALGQESIRERTPMTPFPAPNRLHVWWARRPLVASRAAILASMVSADADQDKFLHALGIHGDPIASRRRIAEAKRSGERFEGQAYDYPRAFTHNLSEADRSWIDSSEVQHSEGIRPRVLDVVAGGGSIPFEAHRLGYQSVANDLNPVAWLILKATIDFPSRLGDSLVQRFNEMSLDFIRRRDERLIDFFPAESDPNSIATNWLWARTIQCPYCAGVVPLSPNWRLNTKGDGVRLVPHVDDPSHRHCSFEMVSDSGDQSPGTVDGGEALCPFPDCARPILGLEIKAQAQAGQMGQQLFAVIFKKKTLKGYTKAGKPKFTIERGYREPRPQDNNEAQIRAALDAKMAEWSARNIVPDESYPADANDLRPIHYGMRLWKDMFSPRQLYGHCTSVEVYNDMVEELR